MNTEKYEPVEASALKEFSESTAAKEKADGLLFQSLENFFTKNSTVLIIAASFFTLLFSLLLFDVRMSTGNDDSMYIESAYNFSKDFHNFPAANAPLYPVFLSIFISMFGLNVILLKSINVIFILLNIVFIFLAFRKRVPTTVLFIVLFITALNSYFLYFASQTYSEAMGLVLQSLFFLTAFNVYDKVQANKTLKESWKEWLLLGLVTFLFAMSRNVALLAIPVLILFFVLDKKYIAAIYALGSFLIFRVPYEIIRRTIWGAGDQYSGQFAILSLKDPYNPLEGNEDLSGFLTRVYQNAYLYISKRLLQILGFKSPDSLDVNGIIVFLFIILVAVSLFFILKNKNKYLLLTTIYFIVLMLGTFVVLQVQWDQPRLVMMYVPLILLVVFSGFYYMFQKKSLALQIFTVLIMLVIFVFSSISTLSKSSDNFPILKENLSGNIYYGYTPDWVNYLRMSAWCGENLPEESYVAVRKAPMSFVYSHGKKFYPVYNVFATDADSVLAAFKRENVTHVIVASLRRNSKINDGKIINTMQRLLYPVEQKYPAKLQLITTIGDAEPAYLYEIKY